MNFKVGPYKHTETEKDVGWGVAADRRHVREGAAPSGTVCVRERKRKKDERERRKDGGRKRGGGGVHADADVHPYHNERIYIHTGRAWYIFLHTPVVI